MSRIRRLLARVDRMPKAPFIAAVAAAAVLAVAAWATAPDGESDVEAVEEVTYQAATDAPSDVDPEEAAEAELIEYGFGALAVDGEDRFGLGAVLRNPHPELPVNVLLEAEAIDLQGQAVTVDRFRITVIAPDTEVVIGRILDGDADEWEAPRYELSVDEVSFRFDVQVPPDRPQIQFSLLEVEKTVEPEGRRLVYRAESDLNRNSSVRTSVVFRDSSGRIVGGLFGTDRPGDGSEENPWTGVPPGESVRHFYLESGEVPEGADLDRTQLGPAGSDLGG